MIKYTDRDYLSFDPFEGDQDVDVRCQTVKMVKVKKEHPCSICLIEGTEHNILPGEKARFESALVDGEWGSYYCCIPGMEKYLNDINGYQCSECEFWDYDDESLEYNKCLCKDGPFFGQIKGEEDICDSFENYEE